jgi:type IV pilus assembly protein PilW
MKDNNDPIGSGIHNNSGVTLIELMVAMALATIVLAGVYAAYSAQARSHATQQAVVGIQQNLRSAMFYLQRSVRMAGYGSGAGFVDDFSAFIEPYASAPVTRNSTTIAFTFDEDDDGEIDGTVGTNVDNVNNELIAYRLNGNTLQRYRPSTDDWQRIADNIQTIRFGYLDEDLQSIPEPVPLIDIRSIEISITAQPVEALTRTAAKSAQSLTVQIRCRNL